MRKHFFLLSVTASIACGVLPTGLAGTAWAAPAATVTTMAMQGGFTFVFQLPAGYKLRERTKPSTNCDTMVWMKQDAGSENDGVLYELSVINPTATMSKETENETDAQIAQDLLSGKANQFHEFHQAEPREATVSSLKCIRIDFDGTRTEGAPKLEGFQITTKSKDKIVNMIVQAPETAQADLKAFTDLVKTLQIQ